MIPPGELSSVGTANSVMEPVVVIRPIYCVFPSALLGIPTRTVNQTLSSGPFVIPPGLPIVIANCVSVPDGVMRPIPVL